MLLAAAVCPHPPLLVPEAAAGAAPETGDLRAACRAAVAALPPETLVVGTAQAVDVGRWLLPNAATHVVQRDLAPADAAALGRALVADTDRALLVMGDGTACRSVGAPGYLDDRAAPYDAAVAAALAAADTGALLGLDSALDDELLVGGRAAWQVLAGAAAGRTWRATLHYDAAPYGVGYFVATWLS
ncbi:MAG TPA: hypothetical protein VNA20_12530 [Frankiaceae bacterium]|nr:hypothetical protein [Frankiaceae bacterium]